MEACDAVVVGSGPNGLAAALTLAQAGLRVEVFEGASTVGGGTRTAALTIDGFWHDACSAVHPSLVASPFFRALDLPALGIDLCQPEVAFAHPLDGGRAAALYRSVDETATGLGGDGAAYRGVMGPLVEDLEAIVPYVLGPMRSMPRHPLALARFARVGVPSAQRLAARFHTDSARALVAGTAAHSMEPLTGPLTSAFGLLLAALGHGVGWPVVAGGSGRIAEGLTGEIIRLGGTVHTARPITSLAELPAARAVLLDTSPRQFLALAGPRLSARRRTVTVHVGGTFEEVARGEAEVQAGRHPERPFVLVAQASVVDSTRAPDGQHTLWGYCHVPNGSSVDMTERMEAQIERFAPGFRDRIVARTTRTAVQSEAYNPNFLGGDINGGAATLRQTAFRPVARWNPYRTPLEGVYLCSASTPPGGGVHGMCGFLAARSVLGTRF